MGVYLRDHPPVRSQYRSPRRATPSGVVVVHTAESVMDAVGPDTGAENVAAFIQRRTNAGSYHDLVDSDSAIQLVEYGDEAYQDGTGSNPHALSISFALSAADWPRLSPTRRAAFLHQGAVAFARQQAWLRAHGYPTTPLRRINRAQSDARVPGFISHAERDPSRRTDPGAGFPWAEFLDHCRTAVTPAVPVSPQPREGMVPTMMIVKFGGSKWRLITGDRIVGITEEFASQAIAAGVPYVGAADGGPDHQSLESALVSES